MDVDLGAQLPEEQQGEFIRTYKEFIFSYREKSGILKWCENLLLNRRRTLLAKKLDDFLMDVIRRKFNDVKQDRGFSSRSILALSLRDTDALTQEIIDGTKDQLKTFLFAGHDTTSILLQWAFYELSRTPRAMRTLRAELESLFGPDLSPEAVRKALLSKGEEITRKMTYTSAVIKEILRLYPPAGSARLCPPGSNFYVHLQDGTSLCAEGMVLYNCATIIQRDANVFGSTKDDFVPERWLGNTDTSMATNDDEKAGIGKAGENGIPATAWRPFERGPRNCIGQELANIEARVILASVVGKYDFEKVGLGEATLGPQGKPIINEKGQHRSNTELYNTIRRLFLLVYFSAYYEGFKMRSALILAAVAGVSSANPVVIRAASAQTGIDLSAFDAAPKPVKVGPAVGATSEKPTYNAAQVKANAAKDALVNPVQAANSTIKARDLTGCTQTEPQGAGPVSSPDSYDQFMSDAQYDAIANNAATPQGYTQSFQDLAGSVEGPGYQGLYTLQAFDTIKCQQYCDAAPVCYGFNVFMERNPAYTPSNSCTNPPSTTNYKCTLWGYIKNAPPASQSGFTGPAPFGGSIQAPNSYIGVKFFPGPYDPAQCAAACQATTQYDHDHPRQDGTYDACNFFNSFVLSENNVPQGTYCSLYTKAWDKSYSTNVGQYRGSDYYSVSQSYGYTLTTQDSGVVSSN
ncbi:cytochrome p450 [Colletotrichum karsti]|uniref:Cytochrome p450 n=1 Tax=Colletotrichum karsti TaxID=1095194 RepID=A0A9P6I1J5_9PEZI|nr:cytochrome p450 [Colletotrichum karsti]KAF9874534.1 cytochrome p450 [Colletotrichum karsti]